MHEIELSGIGKDYYDRRVLSKVDLSLAPGLIGLLGPNGAGKSTLLGILATQLKATTGAYHWGELDVEHDAHVFRRNIGVVGHYGLLYPSFSVQENLLFYARLYDVSTPEQRVKDLLEQFQIADRFDSAVQELSRGLLQRVALARALLHEPKILLLDEPFTGLDAESAGQFEDFLLGWRSPERWAIFTTHALERAARCADRLLVMHRGRIRADVKGPVDIETLRMHYRDAQVRRPLKKTPPHNP